LRYAGVSSACAPKGDVVTTKSGEVQPGEARSDANFKKEERARDGAKAMMEYLANSQMVRDRMEQLRALRLAKEAAEQKAAESKAQVAALTKTVNTAKRAGKIAAIKAVADETVAGKILASRTADKASANKVGASKTAAKKAASGKR
jgi:hypothetical protein